MFRFTVRSLMAFTAFLMTYIVVLTRAPPIAIAPLLAPGFVAGIFLPFISVRLLGVLMDIRERTFESDRLQNCLFATAVCMLAFCPWIAFVYSLFLI